MNSFWETAPASYYCALINWEGWLLIGKVNADGQTWQCPADYKLSDYDPSKTYVLRVSFTGANIKAYVNDALYIDYTDPSPLSGTGIGFRSTGDRTVLKLNYIHQN